ncbi:Hsp20/alpha crystallin family protein [Spirulina sp. CS-785/01]|uniref:Hsp20/alpha crystallin family protein n=1 Tax=Spirulina sp. CS-785/01 TaxID=3021716 RepID=UPI00232AF67D|nr:Hsp20/alpha crystallin family protein [Spirulina sp. CS-785/01]MDB9314061.1 Hsp20/alpha crystallin family protein [Spirulina sp. CS-785/01]
MVRLYRPPQQDVNALRRQMNDVLYGRSRERHPQDSWQPPIELENFRDRFVLRVLLPGVSAEDINLSITREAVILQGKRPYQHQPESRGYFHAEFKYGDFQRVIQLPMAIHANQAQAKFEHGILTLDLPKVVTPTNQVIKVRLTETPAATKPEFAVNSVNSRQVSETQPETPNSPQEDNEDTIPDPWS